MRDKTEREHSISLSVRREGIDQDDDQLIFRGTSGAL